MKYCIYGSNAREHSTFNHFKKKLECKDQLFLISESSNAFLHGENQFFQVSDARSGMELCKKLEIDLVLFLNFSYFSRGYTELFEKAGLKVFSLPYRLTALENSKIFAKYLMTSLKIPTPEYYVFHDFSDALECLETNWKQKEQKFVIKTDKSSSQGKLFDNRVLVPNDLSEANSHIHLLKKFPYYNAQGLILEKKIEGFEISLHLFTDGQSYQLLPLVQDYKKIYEENQGMNTNGIGCLATTYPILSDKLRNKIEKQIVVPFLEGIQRELSVPYQYILYLGIMIDKEENVYCLECNTRSGNPEWSTILPLLKTPLWEIIQAIQRKSLHQIQIEWEKDLYSMTVMMIGAGYPNYKRPFHYPIQGIEKVLNQKNVDLIGENILFEKEQYWTGKEAERVLGIVSQNKKLESLRKDIYKSLDCIKYKGYYYREDIGKEGFIWNN